MPAFPVRAVLATVLSIAPAFAPASNEAATALADARALLASGDAAAAFERAELGLEYARDDVDLLDVASQAAAATERKDVALWYAELALEHLGGGRDELASALRERIDALDPLDSRGPQLVGEYVENVYQLARKCARRKLYVNACDLFDRCRDTARAADAAEQRQKLLSNDKAVAAVLESGLDVPFRAERRKSEKEIARWDREHAEWDAVEPLKGKSYTVYTDMGYAMAEDILDAMEQVNKAYRSVFGYRERGGSTARCNLYVYKSREEFDRVEGDRDKGIKGFFVPGANSVHTYDPRTEEPPRSLASLWTTLFHEASHQFTEIVLPNDHPTWLNEGTASYFEGAFLLQNGALETNRIPPSRLRNLKILMDRGRPTLEDVVTFFRGGSYPGSYYPWGWGLVYFMKNYEDESCERIYEPAYAAFMKSYKSGGQHDVKDRFVEHFVRNVKDPEVTTFEQFDARFRTWIKDLYDVYFGPPERADRLIEHARKERDAEKLEAAVETYRFALRKRPKDALALYELAGVHAQLGEKDAAIYDYRRSMEVARAETEAGAVVAGFGEQTAEEVVGDCLARLEKLDKEVYATLSSTDEDFATASLEAAREYAEAGLPLAAVRVLDGASRALGGAGPLSTLRERLVKESGVETRRWSRLPIDPDLEAWEPSEAWTAKDGALAGEAGHMSFLVNRRAMPETYRYEARLSASSFGDHALFGLLFGVNAESDLKLFSVSNQGRVFAMRFADEPSDGESMKALGSVSPERLGELTLAVEVRPGGVEFFVDGESRGSMRFGEQDVRGKVGLFVQGCALRTSDLRVKYE